MALSVRQGRHTQSFGFIDTLLQGAVVDLLVQGRVLAAFSVDVVREHIVTVVDSARCRFGVPVSIGVESWLAEVSCEGRIRQPAGRIVESRLLLSQGFLERLRFYFDFFQAGLTGALTRSFHALQIVDLCIFVNLHDLLLFCLDLRFGLLPRNVQRRVK